MKVPYDQLPEEFKQYFEHTAYGEEIIYAIYKRHGYCEISFWEWNASGREDDSETIRIEIADKWQSLSEENQRNVLQIWKSDIFNTYNRCKAFMDKYV